jgi:hypothetical protein
MKITTPTEGRKAQRPVLQIPAQPCPLGGLREPVEEQPHPARLPTRHQDLPAHREPLGSPLRVALHGIRQPVMNPHIPHGRLPYGLQRVRPYQPTPRLCPYNSHHLAHEPLLTLQILNCNPIAPCPGSDGRSAWIPAGPW